MTQPTAPTTPSAVPEPAAPAPLGDESPPPNGPGSETQERNIPPQPVVSGRRARIATAVLLALWGGVTLAARPLYPPVASLASRIEVALGLDIALGDDDGKGND